MNLMLMIYNMATKKVNTVHKRNITFSPANDWQEELYVDMINMNIAILRMQIEENNKNNNINVEYTFTGQ